MDMLALAIILKKSKAYTDTALAAIISGLIYKGSVNTVSDLPEAGADKIGWLYTVLSNGHQHLCDGTQWVDTSIFVGLDSDSDTFTFGKDSGGAYITY